METDAQPAETTCYRHPDRRAGVRCQRCERLICPSCMSTASVGFHCPECTRTGKQKVYTRATLDVLNRPVTTFVLIAINVAVFVAGLAYASGEGLARAGLDRVGGLIGESAFFGDVGLVRGVEEGDWWRIVTSGFLHHGEIHLLFNMLALYNLGRILEPVLGPGRFVAVYAASLLTG